MGTQFTPNSIPRNIIIMKFLIGLRLVAVAVAVPIELTPEVATATKEHLAAHAAALKGEHAALAPVQGPAFYLADTVDVAAAKPYLADAADVAAAKPYLADTADVAAAKVEFQKYFDAAAAGTPLTPVTVPVAPVVVPKVVVPQVAAPVNVAAPIVSYTVPSTYYAGYHPYHYTYPYHYANYGLGLPLVSAPVVAAEAKEAVVAEE